MEDSPESQAVSQWRASFTMIELIIVVICIVIIGLFVGFLIPLLDRHDHRHTARRLNCAGNLKQIGLALVMYSGENDGFFLQSPDGTNFEPLNAQGILNDGNVYGCPSATKLMTTAAASSYWYAGSGLRDDHPAASETLLAYDQPGNHSDNQWMNALFIDVHVEGAKPDGSKTWNTYPPPRGVPPPKKTTAQPGEEP